MVRTHAICLGFGCRGSPIDRMLRILGRILGPFFGLNVRQRWGGNVSRDVLSCVEIGGVEGLDSDTDGTTIITETSWLPSPFPVR
jgi:hypothetical protein